MLIDYLVCGIKCYYGYYYFLEGEDKVCLVVE